jgi:hypothetical protein
MTKIEQFLKQKMKCVEEGRCKVSHIASEDLCVTRKMEYNILFAQSPTNVETYHECIMEKCEVIKNDTAIQGD